jgi:hypothetical protein
LPGQDAYALFHPKDVVEVRQGRPELPLPRFHVPDAAENDASLWIDRPDRHLAKDGGTRAMLLDIVLQKNTETTLGHARARLVIVSRLKMVSIDAHFPNGSLYV